MNKEKLKSLVLYICDRVSDPSELGTTKLNKILYYSDFVQFTKTGKSITGEKYVKRQHGPVAYDILKIENELEEENKLVKKDSDFYGYKQRQYFSLKEPELSLFTAEEISTVDKIIETITKNHSATSISLLSHNHVWESAEIGEEIPYYTSLVSELGEIDEKDIEWAKSIISSR